MGRVKLLYHECVTAEQEQAEAFQEDMAKHQIVVEAAEICAEDDEMLNVFLRKVYELNGSIK